MPDPDGTTMSTRMPFKFTELRQNRSFVTLMIYKNVTAGGCHLKSARRFKGLRMPGRHTIHEQKAPLFDIPERVIDFPRTGREA
jgi:hypothetical protein